MAGAPMGEIIYSAVKPVIRMYMIIGTGFFLTRKGLFGVTAARACSDMVLMLFMPALVFDKIVSYISISDIKTIGVICFCAFVMYSINAVVAFLIVRFTPVPKSREERWVGGGLLAGIMQNVSDLPISYIQAVSIFSTKQQNKGTAYVIIWLAMYVVTQFNCGLFQLVNWDFEYMGQTSGDAEKGDQLSHSCSETVQSDQSEKFREENDDDDVHDQNNLTSSTKTSLNSSDNEDLQQPVNNNQASMERPMSEVSSLNISIDSETGIGQPTHGSTSAAHRIQSHPSVRTRASSKQFSENYDPRPLTAVNSRISHLARTLSKGSAIARIPSARSINTNGPNDSDHEDMLSLNQELIREYSRVQPYNQKMSKTMKVVTETNLTSQDVKESGEEIPFIKKYHLHYVVFFLENFKKPMSVSLILAIIIALIPWTKALFVNDGKVTLKNAPDKQPALSFILMYAEYLGAPCVPLGLLLIGSVLARLDVSVLPKGFWKSAVSHTVFRLGVLPIIGMAFITRLKTIGWLTDPMAIFVCVMEFALPSATVQIYLTAGAMRPEDKTSTPLNCFGLYLILQYAVLVISMPIVVCYCIKHPMGL